MKTTTWLLLLKKFLILTVVLMMVVVGVTPTQRVSAAAAVYIKANPTTEKVHVYGWPQGTNVALSIDRSGVVYTGAKTVAQASWDPANPNDQVADFNLNGIFDLQVGDVITARVGINTATVTVTDLTSVRWFIGLGTGTDPSQMQVEQQVVKDFNTNAAYPDVELLMEAHSYPSAKRTLLTEIAVGNPPDIVGPVGWSGSNVLHDYWLDLETLTGWAGYDTSQFNPALVASYHTDEGQVALPFAVYPSAMFYNPALFDESGLDYPPAHYGDKYKLDGKDVDWDWETTVKTVAQRLTIDANGRNATEAGFDKTRILQYGFSFGFEYQPGYSGSYWQSGSILQPGGTPGNYVAAIPDAWKASWKWVYNGMWGAQRFIPNGPASSSSYLGNGNVFNSGKIAMLENPAWYLCCMSDLISNGGSFQLGAMPAYNGQVAGRVDGDTFRILKSSSHPEQAFTALTYLVGPAVDKLIIGSHELPAAYGAMPALTAKQQDFLDKQAAQFPFVTADSWKVLQAGLSYPDSPSAEAWMPNYNEAWVYLESFSSYLMNTPGLNMDDEIAELRADIELIFNLAPTVLEIFRSSPNPSAAASVNFTVEFSKDVMGVDKTDFSLTATGSITGASITSVSGAGRARIVTVNTGSGSGTLRLDVIDNDSIVDEASQPLGGPGAGNGNFTSGQAYIVRPVTRTFLSQAAQDGWVLESSETSGVGGVVNSNATTINLGDNVARGQYRGILSFNTGASLPDNAVIISVTLKVKQQGIVGGGNPLTAFGGLMVDIRQGFFGTTSALQAADFQAAASKSYGPFTPALAGNWYTIDLTGAKPFVNKLATGSGLTQIRLRFKLEDNNNAIANVLSLYSGNAPAASRPQLIVTYYVP